MGDKSPLSEAQVVCRTCNGSISNDFHALDEVQSFENHSITLADLLLDVARIDTKTEASENEFPKHLCDNCTHKLKSAYEFVLQAREVNERLLTEFFKRAKSNENLNDKSRPQDFLLEEEVEVPIFDNNELVQVKLEVDCGDFLNSAEQSETPIKDEALFESEFIEKDGESKALHEDGEDADKQLKNAADPLVNNSDVMLKEHELDGSGLEDEASPINAGDDFNGDFYESESEEDSEPLTKRTRSAVKAASRRNYGRDENNCYVCNTCGESFCLLKDLNRHMARHKNNSAQFDCPKCDRQFDRRSDYKSHRCMSLYRRKASEVSTRSQTARAQQRSQKIESPISFKSIQCCLCEASFESLRELREHLEVHKDGSTGVEMNDKSLYFKTHYPNGCEGQQQEITARIAADFLKKDFTAYYSALDDSANELDLDDSETEDECFVSENLELSVKTEKTLRSYACEICDESFDRVKKIQEHQELKHSEDTERLKQCDVCQERFVSSDMLERHQRNICKNVHKIHQCPKCPLKFVWPENLEAHMERSHGDDERGKNQCEECGKIFAWPKDLRRHRLIHSSEGQKFKCHLCPRKFFRSDQLKNHLDKFDHAKNSRVEERSEFEKATDKLQCQVCGKKIAYAKNLARHMQMHAAKPERYQCHICTFKFNRKDNLYAHLKLHGDEAFVESWKEDLKNASKHPKSKGVIDNQCKPNGNKCIQCMICLALHSTIADLRKHLREHQYVVTWGDRKEPIEKISVIFYPGEKHPVTQEKALIHRIQNDIKAHRVDRFYSITNEFGLELNIDSSETETEVNDSSDEDDDDYDGFRSGRARRARKVKKYSCDLCDMTFNRKYKVFEHQNNKHDWEAAPHYCTLCNSRFLNRRMLERHWEKFCHNKRKRFICRKCPMRFMWKANLANHTRLSHMPKIEKAPLLICRFECDECGRKYLMKKDLTRHMLTHKAKTPLMKCLFCPMSFFKKEYFDGHIRQHGIEVDNIPTAESMLRATRMRNGAKDIKCQNCNTTFKTIAALRVHLQLEVMSGMTASHIYNSSLNYSITNALGFEMSIDDSETDGEMDDETAAAETAMDSMAGQMGLAEYNCEICNLAFKRKFEVAQHQFSAHSYESLPLKCEKCIFKTVNKKILEHHRKNQCENVEKQFQCEKCTFKFMWPGNLEKHRSLMHGSDLMGGGDGSINEHNQGDSLSEIVIFQCDQCPSKYCSKERLVRHIKSCHAAKAEDVGAGNANDDDPSSSGQNSGATKRKQFLCSFCGCALASASNLTIHMRKHTGEKPFKCDFCDMAFPKCSDMRVHRRVHTGEKPYPCQICGKAFSRSYKLKLHMRVHSGEKPYKCNQCDKRFTQSSELTLHIRRHTGEKPYICNICGLRFVQGTALRRHQKKRNHVQIAQAMAEAMAQRNSGEAAPAGPPPAMAAIATSQTPIEQRTAMPPTIAEEF